MASVIAIFLVLCLFFWAQKPDVFLKPANLAVMMRFVAMDLIKRELTLDHIYVSMERNMKCGIGLCGHCQYGPIFVCKDGPVFSYDRVIELLARREI